MGEKKLEMTGSEDGYFPELLQLQKIRIPGNQVFRFRCLGAGKDIVIVRVPADTFHLFRRLCGGVDRFADDGDGLLDFRSGS